MLAWTIETLDRRVDREIASLPADIQAHLIHIGDMLTEYGPSNVGLPHVRHLEGALWEIRMKGRDGIGRAIYVTTEGRRIVILHAFTKKTQKTPAKALAKARKRAKEV